MFGIYHLKDDITSANSTNRQINIWQFISEISSIAYNRAVKQLFRSGDYCALIAILMQILFLMFTLLVAVSEQLKAVFNALLLMTQEQDGITVEFAVK